MAIGASIVVRVEIDKTQATFGELVNAIQSLEGDLVAIDVISSSKDSTTRDITVNTSEDHYDQLISTISNIEGLKIVNISDTTFLAHLGGKIEIKSKSPIKNRADLSRVYTPGVAKVCMAIHKDRQKAFSLTIKKNMIAVVSDGSAVLGLGNIGPEAAMPVMEGKAMLFKQLADVDAFPICLNTQDTEEIIQTIINISPSFGGINLEDISSPRCFEIEARLKEVLDIPVFHDDQHGTAVVILAGLFNALKIVKKTITDIKVVVMGAGAAGAASAKMLLAAGVTNIICVDRQGALVKGEDYNSEMMNWLGENTNPHCSKGLLSEVIEGADVFVGLSGPNVLKVEDVKKMAVDPIIFAMANPEPEIDYDLANPYVRVMATGRSDYPNQINNVLCFPGIFRGALDCRAKYINEEMKLAAAQAIASVVNEQELNEHYIIPSIFNDRVVTSVRKAVIQAAINSKVADRIPKDFK